MRKIVDFNSIINPIIEFFRGKQGMYFLVFLEWLLLVFFLSKPELYYDASMPGLLDRFYADSIIICGALWLLLVTLTVKEVSLPDDINRLLTFVTGCLMPFLVFIVLEAYNDLQFWGPVSLMERRYVILDLVIYYAIYLILLLIFNSVKGASIAFVLLFAFFGIMNYELTVFRNMSFIASDIYSLVTAVAVANTYEIRIDVETAELFMLALVLCAFLLKLRRIPLLSSGRKRFAFAAGCLLMSAAFLQFYVRSDALEKAGVDFRVYRPQYKYRYYGTLLTTVRTFGYLHVKEPQDYSPETVKKDMEPYLSERRETVGKEKAPNIICVMNESFSDLGILGNLPVSEDYMPFFRSLKDNTIKGFTYTSVFGGNTANSEFEFLTGNTMAFLPDNSVPYQLFLRGKTPGLTFMLKDQGYDKALALHPYYQTGYSRYKVYPEMGFDRFYTSDDFSIFTDTINYHITDAANYQKIEALYELHDKSSGPFYMFNVTMQNHGSYSGSTAQTGDRVRLLGEYSRFPKAEEFLNMIRMSDDALKELVEYFRKVDEPTVILFFGDHMPDLDDGFYDTLVGKAMDELEGEELNELYRIPFLIWANYDIEEEDGVITSNNYLSTYLADAAGIEKTPYLSYLSDLREDIPMINALGYRDALGRYYDTEDSNSPMYRRLEEYHRIEYNNLFGGEDRVSDFFYLNSKP